MGGREPLTYFQSKNLAHSGMEVALPSEDLQPLWVPMNGGLRKGKVPGNDFSTYCQDMSLSGGGRRGNPAASEWLSHKMGPCENLHLQVSVPTPEYTKC